LTKEQIKKLDQLASKIVRERGKCQLCSSVNGLNTAHIISRNYKQVRWDLDNLLCLCFKCHRRAHDYPFKFDDDVHHLIGDKKYRELYEKAKKKEKLFYEEIYEKLSQ